MPTEKQKKSPDNIRLLIQKVIKEMSLTGGGTAGAGFSPGVGGQYATPFAFNPNKKAKGAARNYYLKLGWKLVDRDKLKKKAKTYTSVDLWK